MFILKVFELFYMFIVYRKDLGSCNTSMKIIITTLEICLLISTKS